MMDIKRRFLLPFLSVLLFLRVPIQSEAAVAFSDIGGAEFEPHVKYIAERGIIKGYTENGKTLYKPNQPVTRFQAAKMLVIATGNEHVDPAGYNFKDVNGEEKHYIQIAAKLGFFSGYPDGTFKPNATLKRG